jgi:hypothetical protein
LKYQDVSKAMLCSLPASAVSNTIFGTREPGPEVTFFCVLQQERKSIEIIRYFMVLDL